MAEKLLNIGIRLGLLKEAWGYPINQDLADSISGNTRDQTREKGRLDYSTVHRWATKGTAPREYSEERIAAGVAARLDETGYLKNANVTQEELIDALCRSDDVRFSSFISGTSKTQLPIPKSVKKADKRKIESIKGSILGKHILYRLGVEVKRRGRMVFFDGSAKNVLRCVPIQFTEDGSGVVYQEDYFGNRSAGYALLIDQYLTVWGEDTDQAGFSELFLTHIVTEPNHHGLLEGVVAMDGDLGQPTAYRLLFRRASDEDQALDWDTFVRKQQKTVPLKDINGDGAPFETAEIEEETGTAYQDYVLQLHIKDMKTDLQH